MVCQLHIVFQKTKPKNLKLTVMRNLKWVKRNEPFLPSVLADQFNTFFNDDVFRNEYSSSRPLVNISENENGFGIELAAPGLSKEDFNIDLDNDLLTISAERKVENTEEGDKYTKREFNYTTFKRSFTLPESVDTEAISGTYENGILNITLPKKAEVQKLKRAIEIA